MTPSVPAGVRIFAVGLPTSPVRPTPARAESFHRTNLRAPARGARHDGVIQPAPTTIPPIPPPTILARRAPFDDLERPMSLETKAPGEIDRLPLPPHLLENFEKAERSIRETYGKSPPASDLLRLWIATATSWEIQTEFERTVLSNQAEHGPAEQGRPFR